ncbi:histidine phosphatase family protein [Ramlibacter tataouinensis]|uniref:histidine phosphatase family protein n=1 Tax=Ramlibacter tataouinensis TaxID=94132 RepID=UPI0022F3D6D9|nr:histidine phosphatase family protein [Ramlibacter tataouinensis]WBY02628.1 histidine phosphatase family protein [Ramlibacter tataouinensis]
MTTFLLVRHGAHDWLGRGIAGRLPGVSLNAHGWLQAEALVRRLDGWDIAAIYSSPQPRAQETVAPLAGRRRLPVRVLDAFDEIDFGEWAGRDFEALAREGQRWRDWCEHRSQARPPGGETLPQVRQRAVEALEQLRQRHPAGAVLIASHGDVIKAVLATVLHMSLDDLERFEVAPGSLSIVEAGQGWLQVRLVNATGGDVEPGQGPGT